MNVVITSHAELTSSITSIYRLAFSSVMSEDTGTYICRAYNQFGVPASAQITLQLSGKFKNRINDNAIVYMYVYVTAYKNNNIMLINLLILGGGDLGVCSPRKNLTFQPLKLFLVASETWLSV